MAAGIGWTDPTLAGSINCGFHMFHILNCDPNLEQLRILAVNRRIDRKCSVEAEKREEFLHDVSCC